MTIIGLSDFTKVWCRWEHFSASKPFFYSMAFPSDSDAIPVMVIVYFLNKTTCQIKHLDRKRKASHSAVYPNNRLYASLLPSTMTSKCWWLKLEKCLTTAFQSHLIIVWSHLTNTAFTAWVTQLSTAVKGLGLSPVEEMACINSFGLFSMFVP